MRRSWHSCIRDGQADSFCAFFFFLLGRQRQVIKNGRWRENVQFYVMERRSYSSVHYIPSTTFQPRLFLDLSVVLPSLLDRFMLKWVQLGVVSLILMLLIFFCRPLLVYLIIVLSDLVSTNRNKSILFFIIDVCVLRLTKRLDRLLKQRR